MIKTVHGGDVYRHPGVIDFSSNMNPLGTPERVIRAAQESMTEICHYPDVRQEELIRALSAYEKVPEDIPRANRIMYGTAVLAFLLSAAVRVLILVLV